jgi:hypothetical protein
MALDPNIALGVRQIELPNQLAQYAQLSQIRNAQNQNRMAEMQLQEYERARGEEEGLRNYLTSTDFTKPENRAGLLKFGKTGREYIKSLAEQDTAALTAKNVQSQINERDFGLQKKKLDFAWSSVGSASTPQDAIQKINEGVRNGVFDMKGASADIQQLQNMTPEQYQQYRVQKVMGILDAKDKLGFMLPKIARQDTGAFITPIQDNPALPGYGLPVAGMAAIPKTATFGERTAQGQLGLAQAKFAFEKANPTLSIQDDGNGMLAVNTITGVATPVVYGPTGFQAAPAAAPGASMMRQPPAALPGQRVAAIPGMTSVLDRTAAPAAMPVPAEVGARMPGMPVGSKKEAPVKFKDTDMQLAGLAGSLKDFKEEINKNLFTGAKYLPSGADTSRMTAKYTALLMGVKDLYTLGALTGPDMSIIESQLTNPASWSGKFKTKEGFNEQVKVIEDMLKRSTTNLETTYGRVPKASRKALEGLPGGAAGGISGATANDPLGLGIK